jgi:hypothetical protein
MKLTDAEIEEMKASLNNAIHELVFACQHLDQDDMEDASVCLMTAQGTIETVANRVVKAEG